MKTCTQDGCHSKTLARGLCRMHYQRERRKPKPDFAKCSEVGCARHVEASGVCSLHYHRAWVSRNAERVKNTHLQNKFKISFSEYQELVLKQSGKCAICALPETVCNFRTGKPLDLAVDHDHGTGHVRGLLCYKCNSGVGYFDDDPHRLGSAISYLTCMEAA